MIVVTGAAGFIGSCLVSYLLQQDYRDLVAVDDFSRDDKAANLAAHPHLRRIHRDRFFGWLASNQDQVQFVFHLGARTDTAEFDEALFDRLNLEYSKQVWQACVKYGLPLVYASSAATYGGGEHGYEDRHDRVPYLRPLNPYGVSKNEFDKWALAQEEAPYFWAGLKFFNVYGPNEYHKGRMASVVWHAYQQVLDTGQVKLFRSHRPDYADGEQKRDFVYVQDVAAILFWLMHHRRPEHNGLYNLGTGQARTFKDLAKAVFAALGREPNIQYIDTPADIRDKYQYFTEAPMHKLRAAGYTAPFHSLEEGIADYVRHYLQPGCYF
jgi:ADP-L-glycero-D-manno-heptose 6-epimerase